MGTRGLTCVVRDGKFKVAKYNQWDSYPEGMGAGILNFLRNDFNKSKFLEGLKNVRFGTDDEIKKLWEEAGADGSGWVTMEVSEKFKRKNFPLYRDCGGDDLIKLIQENSVTLQQDSSDFAGDSLFCEWAYVLDLDKNQFEVYRGFNKTKLDKSERFANFKNDEKSEYEPVKLVKIYNLNELPTVEDFINELL
jgi:hypothetical protein